MTQGHKEDGTSVDWIVHGHNQLPLLAPAAIQDVERTDLLSPLLIAPLTQYLLTHFHREETELFPRAERIHRDPPWPETASLRREHLALRELLGEIAAALARRDRAGAHGNLLELATALRLHCDRENLLYNQGAFDVGQTNHVAARD